MNKTDPTQKINMVDLVGEMINSRQVSDLLQDKLTEATEGKVYLDFSDVEFVSRSAAHELIRLQERLRNQTDPKSIMFTNMSTEVRKMIRTVAANRALPKSKKREVNIEKVSADEIFKSA